MSIQLWATEARRSEYRQQSEHQRAIDTLVSMFEQRIEPMNAAHLVVSDYEPLLRQHTSISPVVELWGMICEAIRLLGSNKTISESLIDMINSIAELPDVLDIDGNPVRPRNGLGSNGIYWRDLPDLAIMLREYAFDITPEMSETPDESDWTDAQKQILISVTTFGAHYLVRGSRPLGMPSHAEFNIMDGIEESYQTPEAQGRAPVRVTSAATWILIAAEKIFTLSKLRLDRNDGLAGSALEGDQWGTNMDRGFSLGRWALWKKQFQEISMNGGLDQPARDIALKAAAEMDRVGTLLE